MAVLLATMIQKIMAALYLNQSQLAKKLGVNKAQISRWLNGGECTSDNYLKLSNLYNEVKDFKRLDDSA